MEVSGKNLRKLCKPCEKRKSTTYTDKSCLHCEEEMCQSCFDTHVQFKVSREHRLVKSLEVPTIMEETPKLENCTKHLNEAIKFLCPEHNQVACADCIIISHKNCKVEYILEYINEYKVSEKSKRFKTDVEKYDSEAKAMLERINRNKIHVKYVNRNFARDVNLFKSEMISHITYLTEAMLKLADEAMTEDVTKIENLEKENKKLVDETTKMRETLQSKSDQPYKLFITTVSYKQNLQLVKEQLQRIDEMNTVRTYTFKPDCHLDQVLKSAKQLGSIQGLKQLKTGIAEVPDVLPEFPILRGLEYHSASKLSKVCGARLTDNNPNIAEQSDPNHPTKIAEQFSELYDNLWTDAFETLKNEENTACLLKIIVDCFEICGKVSKNHQRNLKNAVCCPVENIASGLTSKQKREKTENPVSFSAVQSKTLSELRKQTADISVAGVISQIESAQTDWFVPEKLRSYTTRCIELCWLMHVQTPPVVIDRSAKPGSKFDTNKYKQYTKAGKKIDFIVWPVLLLEEGGAILCKGVAQGK